jgi:hypothetical protein
VSADEFAARRQSRLHARAQAPAPLLAVFLQKPDRQSRLYRIDRLTPSTWRCEVWLGAAIHRTMIAPTRAHMMELQKQFRREVAALLEDGWSATS